MIETLDDAGRRVVLPRAAQRIVSLVPSLTETVFALGAGAAVVGVTRYCVEPRTGVQGVEKVGGTKNPHIERIIGLQPDLVLVNAEENRKEDFSGLEQNGLTVFVSFSHRVRDVDDLVRRIALLTGTVGAGAVLTAELEEALREVERRDGVHRPRVFCPIWKNPWMSFNRDTYADDMLWLAGGENVCRDRAERYCAVRLEEIAAANPEVILLPDEPYVFAAKDLSALAPLARTPACRSNQIHFIDGKALSWYGPRTAAGLRYLRALLQA